MRGELSARSTLREGLPRRSQWSPSVRKSRNADWPAVFVFCATALIAALGLAAIAYVACRFPAFGAVLASLDPY
jgi:hypothetical protein